MREKQRFQANRFNCCRSSFRRFGHQDKVTGIDAGLRERAITSGGTDGSVRVWKIVEESQLVFNAPSPNGASAASVDSVKLLNEESFVTCGEDGWVGGSLGAR